MMLLIFSCTWICTSEELSGAESQGKSPTAKRAWTRVIHQLASFLQQHGNTASATWNFTTKTACCSLKVTCAEMKLLMIVVSEPLAGKTSGLPLWQTPREDEVLLLSPKGPLDVFSNLRRCDWGTWQMVTLQSFVFLSEGYRQEEETAQKS